MASPQSGGDRSLSLAPILGALAVVAVAFVLVLTFGSGNGGGSPDGSEGTAVAGDKALACPRMYSQVRADTNGWVPHAPQGLNGDDRLVPTDESPTHAVVCAYLGGDDPSKTKSIPLTGRSRLQGSLAGLVRTLSAAPRISTSANVACSGAVTAADTHDYLFGISYGQARLWVSAAGYHCEGSTNGSFNTRTNLSDYAAASYKAKRWVDAK